MIYLIRDKVTGLVKFHFSRARTPHVRWERQEIAGRLRGTQGDLHRLMQAFAKVRRKEDWYEGNVVIKTILGEQGNADVPMVAKEAIDRIERPEQPQVVVEVSETEPPSRATRVYLAGKIAKRDWRHSLFPDLRSFGPGDDCLVHHPDRIDEGPISRCGKFRCVGPFFRACDHGCEHGPNSHGAGREKSCNPSEVERRTSSDVVSNCIQRIHRSDVCFAWIDGPKPYGTLFELGLCYGGIGSMPNPDPIIKVPIVGRRIPVFLAVFDSPAGRDFWKNAWFARNRADVAIMSDDYFRAWDVFTGWWQGRLSRWQKAEVAS